MKIKIHARSRSSRNKVNKINEGEYKVWLTESPVDGKANRKLIVLLSAFFKVPKSRIRIIAGASAKTKLVEIG